MSLRLTSSLSGTYGTPMTKLTWLLAYTLIVYLVASGLPTPDVGAWNNDSQAVFTRSGAMR